MKILAHRGFWTKIREQNKPVSFLRALDYGYGVELDVRDFEKKTVISHDLPKKNALSFEKTLRIISKHNNFRKVTYAINIKSDGIENEIVSLIKGFGILKNSFVFDMSMPSTFVFYKKYTNKIHFACRHSDIEKTPVLYHAAKWIWLDELESPWLTRRVIRKHIKNGKRVCIVSSELHGRAYQKSWERFLSLPKTKSICLCTDFPRVADNFFNGERK